MEKKTKIILIVALVFFALSATITLTGALAKLQHWSWAGPFLIVGISLQALSYLLGAIALINYLRKQ